MLHVRRIKVDADDQASVELDAFSTELHECDCDEIADLLAAMANEVAVDHYRFDVRREGADGTPWT